jgi:hypothetical protein
MQDMGHFGKNINSIFAAVGEEAQAGYSYLFANEPFMPLEISIIHEQVRWVAHRRSGGGRADPGVAFWTPPLKDDPSLRHWYPAGIEQSILPYRSGLAVDLLTGAIMGKNQKLIAQLPPFVRMWSGNLKAQGWGQSAKLVGMTPCEGHPEQFIPGRASFPEITASPEYRRQRRRISSGGMTMMLGEPAGGAGFDLKTLQSWVGGYIEIVQLPEDNMIMVINDDGLDRLPINPGASVIAARNRVFAPYICGDVVVLRNEDVK